MATTLRSTCPSSSAEEYPLDAGCFDEAFAPTGAPRRPYAEVMDVLAQRDLRALRERVQSDVDRLGLTFGPGKPMAVDPVPRLIGATEWSRLEAGLVQRVKALNAFLADTYGEQRAFDEGVVPRHLLDTSVGYEPRMRGLLDPTLPAATVAGLDLVRDADGQLLVLEDNLRMPSGSSYAAAIRDAVAPLLGLRMSPRPQAGIGEELKRALLAACPDGNGDPAAAIVSDGPASGAWFEHQALGSALRVPVVTPAQLETSRGRLFARVGRARRQLTVIYRRLDGERLSKPSGDPTPLGELLLPPLESGRLRCLNAFGTGVADDKLAHAYVGRMVAFYLGEEPLLPSVPTIDLLVEEGQTASLDRLDGLVIKPRDGFGGSGVTIVSRAGANERQEVKRLIRRRPECFVAQREVMLSSHPTICGGRLRPRRIDLRPFVLSSPDRTVAMPGGLTRYAQSAGEMIVNSSRGGGCKDTWVVDR